MTGSNRLLEFDGCDYDTDNDGNVTEQDCSGTITSFHWDARNRLDSLNLDGTAYAFRYDPRGRLARVDKNGTHYRYFWWNVDDLVAELDTTGAVVGEYSYRGIDELHAYKKGSTGTKYYAHRDMMGNVVALTDGGSLARTYEYDAWGQDVGGGEWVTFSGKDRARWKGALYFDEFDLYYMRARWYQPATGRFLSEDPIGLAGGINPFVFAAGDPINFSDPLGMRPCRDGEWGVHWDHGTELSEIDDVLVVTSKRKERHWCFGLSSEMANQEPVALTFPAFGLGGIGRLWRAAQGLRRWIQGLRGARGWSQVGEVLKGLRAGSSSRVRLVDSAKEIEDLYGRLSAGGRVLESTNYPGRLVQLSDGTRIGFRLTSRSGGPTIDIHPPSGSGWKVHIGGGS